MNFLLIVMGGSQFSVNDVIHVINHMAEYNVIDKHNRLCSVLTTSKEAEKSSALVRFHSKADYSVNDTGQANAEVRPK